MSSSSRWPLLAAVLALAAHSAFAQSSFDTLDIGGKKPKSKSATTTTPKRTTKVTRKTTVQKGVKAEPTPEPAPTVAPTPEPAPAPVVVTPPPPPPAPKPVSRAKINDALAMYKANKFEQAAVAFYDVATNAEMEPIWVEAQYWLAKTLYKLGMFNSSANYFAKVLARGDQSKFFSNSLEWLFFISRKTVNEEVVLGILAGYATAKFPDRFQSEFHYLLARYNFVRGRALDQYERTTEANQAFAEVANNTLLIPPNDAFYPQAKYLEGVTLLRSDKPQEAVNAMKEVLRVTRGAGTLSFTTSKSAKNAKTLRELTFMQLARIHYGARQNRSAIFYYGKIERGGSQWLESLFEAAWAHYRVGQYDQALGNLVTLASPFFSNEYFPEALILKAVIYFENCRYPEALAIVREFEANYGPVQESLQRLVARQLPAEQYFSVFDQLRAKQKAHQQLTPSDRVMERVLNLALTDTDLKKAVDAMSEIEREMESLTDRGAAFNASNLANALFAQLKLQRETLRAKSGAIAQAKLELELEQLRTMRSNGLRIKFDTVSKEKEFLELKLASGGERATVRNVQLRYAVPDEYLYWPFDGEFWRDELGTYQSTLTKGCIDGAKAVTNR